MKIKILPILIFAALVALTGCKPKQTTLSGQMFIVTQGAENVKLGDVEILLIEKSQAADFLQKKQPMIESEKTSRQKEAAIAAEDELKAIADNDSFLANNKFSPENGDYEPFLSNNYFKTNVECANIKSKAESLLKNYQNDSFQADEFQSLILKLEDAVILAGAEKKNALEDMESRVATAKARSEDFPVAEDFLKNFSPVVIQKTISDADGRFSFIYSRDSVLAIFAAARRMVLNKTEKYYWLINAPTNGESVQIFLSNNNLVEVDPDGYFPLKPKQVSEEATVQ
jgi:hypothetical protein